MSESNWAGTHTYAARRIETPTTIEGAQEVVASAPRVRSLGTRHSFNDIADADGVLLSLTDIAPDPVIDEQARTVTVGGGTRYAVVARYLQQNGWALHNMGSLPHISVAGAVSTATHGSGDRNGNLATAVSGLTFIGPDGGLRSIRRGENGFDGSVVALGALGPVTRVTLDIQPDYSARQDVYEGLEWATLFENFDAITSSAYSVSVFTHWDTPTVGDVWIKERLESDAAEAAATPMPAELFGARRREAKTLSPTGDENDNTTTQGGVPGPWSERLPHFRIDATPSNGDEIQTEYLVGRDVALDAIRAVRSIAELVAPALLITELRTVAADDLWMSTAYGRDSLCIHFTWKNLPDAVAAAVLEVERVLAPFDPRPHWGKVFSMPVSSSYAKLDDFRDLVAATDPDGKFGSPYLERVLGLGR